MVVVVGTLVVVDATVVVVFPTVVVVVESEVVVVSSVVVLAVVGEQAATAMTMARVRRITKGSLRPIE